MSHIKSYLTIDLPIAIEDFRTLLDIAVKYIDEPIVVGTESKREDQREGYPEQLVVTITGEFREKKQDKSEPPTQIHVRPAVLNPGPGQLLRCNIDRGYLDAIATKDGDFHLLQCEQCHRIYSYHRGKLIPCRAGQDGDCNWRYCPQVEDGEPEATGRACPQWVIGDEEES